MSSCSETLVCLRVDARSQKAHVLDDPHTGEVTGLTEPLILHRETANFLKDNPDAFVKGVCNRSHMVAQFSFVFYLPQLDSWEKVVPMAILPSVQGQARGATISSLSVACQIRVDEEVDLRGIAFDGNAKYLHYLDSFKTIINVLQKINCRSPFS
jgi:hypothetical protein